MKNTLLIIFFGVYILLVATNAYSFDGTNQITGNINGKVVDERNFPVPFVKVIIGGSEVESDKFGTFKLPNIAFPYDAVIAERSTATAVMYRNLSVENPDLILFGKPNTRNANTAIINVNFPQIPNGSSAIIKFISQDVFFSEDIEVFSGEKNKTLLVFWPLEQKNINGNIIYLQKSNSSYEVYNDRAVSIFQNRVPFEITFLNNLNNTLTSDLTIYLPFKDYRTKGYSVFADFFAFNRNSQVLLTRQEGNIFKTKSIIPLKLPISYRLKVSGFVSYDNGSGFVNYIYSNPGGVINLTIEDPPELETPSDKLMGANGKTEFSYSLGSGTGVFVINFHSFYPDMNFYIVTSERTSNLNYLSRTEFSRINSVEFKWNVTKHLTYFSVNEFVKRKDFKNDVGYKAVLYSTERTFKTGYF